MPQYLIEGLNPEQREAVMAADGPLLVVAGAGSGKTRVITHRISWLIGAHGVAPWQIFAATFTNKAAEEMRERIGRLLPGAELARLTIATFHSICVGILRREAPLAGLTPRFTICDENDRMALIKDCLRNLGDTHNTVRPEEARWWIDAAKVRMFSPEEARKELPSDKGPLCAKVYEQYQRRLLASDAVDFDDLILHVVRIFQNHPDVLKNYQERWKYILVDEYQDTNLVQFELIRLIADRYKNICVVGDADQSIYSWRGADIENLLRFPEVFPGTREVKLEQNYRSTMNILSAANAVIGHNRQRLEKQLWSERGDGEPLTMIVGMSEREEAALTVDTMRWLKKLQGRSYSEMAIFYRVNALSRVFEDQLRQAGIPYRVIGGIKFYDRAEVKDMLSYLRLTVNPRDSVALARIINRPARGIGQKSLSAIFDESVKRNISLWDILMEIRNKKEEAPDVSGKARAGIANFTLQIAEWSDYGENHTPHALLERILRDTDYEASVGAEKDIDAISRRENIAELVSALEEFHKNDPGSTLADFLERVALVNAQDQMTGDEAVSLMSLHSAKGLEFEVVFMIGMEDPLFPSQRAVIEQGHYEEERRLFYVGITRAKDLLFFSRADSRMLHGRPSYNIPSIFLREIPMELLRTLEDARRQWMDQAGERRRHPEPALREQPGRIQQPRRKVQSPAFHPEELPVIQRGESIPAASEGLFPVGSRVAHARLGAGEVIEVTGQGDRRKVTVQFDAGLTLEILEQYGGLAAAADSDMPY